VKDIPLSQLGTSLHFKKITVDKLKEGGCFNLVDADGKFVAMVIVPISAFNKDQFQALASQTNAALGIK